MTYTAPATKVLTVLHVQDRDVPRVANGPDPSDGMTVCRLPMLVRELWQPVELRDGDVICKVCNFMTGDEQGEMW